MTEDLLALKPGTHLAHYVIERVLGQGGFGIVYKAHHDHLNDPVVIKEFLPSELAGRSSSTVVAHSGSKQGLYEDCLQRFMHEGRVLVKLRHPNVVRCRDLFTDNGTAYLVMDYEDGLPLDELVTTLEAQGSRYSEAQLMHFLMPLIDGLAYVHQQGILHRDIKPANVFIRRGDGSPVLLDFGAAKQTLLKASQSRSPYTEFYAPLEQIAGEGEAHATMDVHAFGGLMYRLVTGTLGPRAETRAMKLSGGQQDPLIPAAQLAGDHYSAELLATIDACLAFRSDDRPQTMEELRSRLAGHPPQESPPGPEPTGFEPLKDLLELAGADGVISDQEMSMLMAKARTLGIDASAAQAHIVSHAHRRGWQFNTGSTPQADAAHNDKAAGRGSPTPKTQERGDSHLKMPPPEEINTPVTADQEAQQAAAGSSIEHRMDELNGIAVRSVVVLSLMTGLLVAGLERKLEVLFFQLADEINAPAILLAAAASAFIGLLWTVIAANVAYRKDTGELEAALAASKSLQSTYMKALGKTWLIAMLILFLFTLIPLRGLFI